MTSPIKAWEMSNSGNFRDPIINEPRIFGGPNGMQTPLGTVRTFQQNAPPTLPPRPYAQPVQQSGYGSGANSLYGGSYMGGMYGGYNSGYNNTGYNYGGGYGGYSGYGGGGYGNSFNRFGNGNPMDPENRFIQIAEESSRPAFQSIESLVNAIGNIATMLDSTFFALTSSFRAILGVAANFGRLRGVFAQFWSTFAILRGLSWLYQKILYTMKISNIDPASAAFAEAFAAAQGIPSTDSAPKKNTAWPILVFLGFIFTAPYLIMKLLGTVSSSALEESKNPKTWVNPIKAHVTYDFQAGSQQELNIRSGQTILIAPREVQNTQKLMNTGWVLATVDNQTSGLIPINYVRGPQQISSNTETLKTVNQKVFAEPDAEHILQSDEKQGDEILNSNVIN